MLLEQTHIAPEWVHFGGGNLYRAFHGEIAQKLAEAGEISSGVIVCETFDEQVIDRVYQPYENSFFEVIMHESGQLEKILNVVTAESHFCHPNRPASYRRMKEVFENPSLKFITVTITEKGYGLRDLTGDFSKIIQQDLKTGPDAGQHTMSIIASLLWGRFTKNAAPIALVSTDNFSRNGLKFQEAILTIATGWLEHNFVTQEFIDYLSNPQQVSFPWSMIDRITPNPSQVVADALNKAGIEPAKLIRTEKGTNLATFANTEETHYLVIEDSFPNGRPDFTKAGVILTDRETVDRTDAMKVTTCLNPLHTTLAVYGCALDYQSIAAEMKDPELVALIKGVGYLEGLPVVDDPKIINPKQFIDELLTKRLPNPLIPDTPQRIASDTSQKVGIRFGETIRKYMESTTRSTAELTYIPLAIAGWFRYLVGVDDYGEPIQLSPDPLLASLTEQLARIGLGRTDGLAAALQPILSNAEIFGVNLYQADLADKIIGYTSELLQGPGAIRTTLKKYTRGE
ncbi:mannitol dehydrogenase family protein [Enterococcus sp. LJL90]